LVGIFKQKNPGNALLLLIYGLFIKFPMFLHPHQAVMQQGDNYLYHVIVKALDPIGKNAGIFYPLLAFILLFTQATLLNRISNSLKLFNRPNYLVAMSYLLVTSLMKEWNYFSAPLIINSLSIIAWYSMFNWYNSNKPKSLIFNTSALVGILPLIYSPALTLIVLLFVALLVTRPFRITEWFVSLIGLATPYYFLFVVLYLSNEWDYHKLLTPVSFHFPQLPSSLWVTGGILFLVVPFLIGGYFVQDALNKMLIQVRKGWSLLLIFLIVTLLVIVVNPGRNYMHWLMMAVPITAFHAAAYYYSTPRWLPLLLHWVIFAFVIMLQYTQ